MAFKNLADALIEIGFQHSTNSENREKTIFEATKNKTRVVISGDQKRSEITSVILHVLNFHNVQADFIIGENYEKASLSTENDFVIIEAKASENLENLRANIALITNISNDENIENYKNFIAQITAGGVLVYNQEHKNLTDLAENSENYFRKFPYQKPAYTTKNDIFFLETELGEIPLKNSDLEVINHMEGARYICQQLGILEENFYEALLTL